MYAGKRPAPLPPPLVWSVLVFSVIMPLYAIPSVEIVLFCVLLYTLLIDRLCL